MISVTQPIIPWIQRFLVYLFITMGTFSLVMGLKVYMLNSNLPINRRTLVFAISSYMWNVGYGIMIFTTSALIVSIERFFALMGAMLWMSQGFILVIEVCRIITNEKRIRRLDLSMRVFGIGLAILLCTPWNVEFTTMQYGVTLYSHITISRIIFDLYISVIVVTCLYWLKISYHKFKLERERKFFKYTVSALLTYPIGCVFDIILPLLGKPAFPGSCFTCFFSMILLYRGALKQNGLSISMVNVAEYIYHSISSPIVVLNEKGDIVMANPSATEFFAEPEIALMGQNIDGYFTCNSSLEWEIQKMLTVGRLVYQEKGVCKNNDCVCELNFSIIKDQYDECLCLILLIHDMTQEHNIMEKLARTSEQAISASKAKSIFLAKMSHDIRTPINAIIGMNEMILREAQTDEIKSYASDIENASKTLLSLINDILDLSKIESGKLDIESKEYMLSSVLMDIINILEARIKEKKLELKLDIDETIPAILIGDEVRMKQIILNLLNNAVKYTEEGYVNLKVYAKERRADEIELVVEITDTGIGIKKDDIDYIFESFKRLDDAKNRGIEGTGLGLNIAYTLLNKMNGDLSVQSEYGKGSTFTIRVPQKVKDHQPMGLIKILNEPKNIEKKRKATFISPESKVLVVDDNLMNLQVFKGLLKKTKIQIDSAMSGQECLELVKENCYDMIFLDHMMPVMDGVETLHKLQLQEDNLCKDTPVIALTANAIVGAKEMYMKEGFIAYISKPIAFQKLENILLMYLPKQKVEILNEDE